MALGWRGSYLRYKEFFLDITALYKQRADLRAFLEIILSISTIVLFLLFAFKPTVLTIISLLQEIKEKETTVGLLDTKINALEKAAIIFDQNQNAIPDIDIAIANNPQPNIITQQTEGLAFKNGVTIVGLSIGQTTLLGKVAVKKVSSETSPLPGNANPMPISISVKGNYPNLFSFIADFENLKIISKIDSIGITASNTDKGRVIVAVISGRLPYIGQK